MTAAPRPSPQPPAAAQSKASLTDLAELLAIGVRRHLARNPCLAAAPAGKPSSLSVHGGADRRPLPPPAAALRESER